MYKIIGGDQKLYGPISADDLRRWIREGRLNGQSLAQLEGSGDWKPLAAFPEFAEALRAQAAPPLPPRGPMLPANLADWRAQLLASPSAVPIGRCLSLSWKLLTANFGLLFGATALVWLIEAVFQRIPLINLVYWVMQGVLYGGLYLVFLKRIRGQPAAVGDVFAGFSSLFPQLLLAGLLTSLLSGIGFAFCFVPGLYLLVAWIFSIPLVADKQLEFWSAMELSRKMVTRVWFEVLGLALLAFLPVILVNVFATVKISFLVFSVMQDMIRAGSPDPGRIFHMVMDVVKIGLPLWFVTKIVLLLNLPFAIGALMYGYENLFGPRPAPAA